MNEIMERVVYRFRFPFGQPSQPVSRTMVDALMLLSETEEMEPMFAAAEKAEQIVSIELFRARNGRPLLIHFTTERV